MWQAAKSGTAVTLEGMDKGTTMAGVGRWTCWTWTLAKEFVELLRSTPPPLPKQMNFELHWQQTLNDAFFASSIWPLDKGPTPLTPNPYFTHLLLVFWMYLSVSMQIVTIKNHFQWWKFSKHTVTPVAIYELRLGGSANGRTNTVLYVHNSGYLVHRGTSPTFCENKKPFPWLFTDDLQRISKSFEHGWTKQLLRIQINGLRPCFFHKLRFGRCRNETCCRLMLSIKAVVRRKPCLISILLTCSLEVDSLSVITAESFLVFRFQPWSHGLWWAFLCWKELVWTMKWRWSLASVWRVHWDVSIRMMNNARISTFDFPKIDFHLLRILSEAKSDFPNFQTSPNVSSVVIKCCDEEHRISSKASLAPKPCVANVYIQKCWKQSQLIGVLYIPHHHS